MGPHTAKAGPVNHGFTVILHTVKPERMPSSGNKTILQCLEQFAGCIVNRDGNVLARWNLEGYPGVPRNRETGLVVFI
jgi:hypothetical protein